MDGRVSTTPVPTKMVVRKKQRFLDAKLLYFTTVAVGLAALLYLAPPARLTGGTVDAALHGGNLAISRELGLAIDDKALGHDLFSRGLYEEAVLAYGRHLSKTSDAATAASLCLLIGDTYKDKLHEPARAASYYLRVRQYDAESSAAEKVGLRVVACLDALGLSRQSQRELNRLTNVDAKDVTTTLSAVVASAGDRDFTVADIEEALDKLPEKVREVYAGKAGKLRFLREQLLGPYLLCEAGRRKGMDRAKDVRSQVEAFERNIIASKMLQERLSRVPTPSEAEVERFYKAEKERYKLEADKDTPERIPPLAEIKEQVARDYMQVRRMEEMQVLFDEQIRAQDVKLDPFAIAGEDGK